MKNQKILITGGTGFIGSNLARKLVSNNKVWVTSRRQEAPPPRTTLFITDIRDTRFLNFLKKQNFNYIFHMAGNADLEVAFKNPRLDFETNASATLSILEVLRKSHKKSKFIFPSSVAVYGKSGRGMLNEEASTLPLSNYGVSKLTAERYTHTFARQYGVLGISIRIFPTYGPGLRRQIVYDLIQKLDRNPNELEILGDGTQARDMIFIEDQVDNMIRIAERADYKGEVYNSGSGELYTTKKIGQAIAKAMRLSPKFTFTNKARIFDGQVWRADITKIKKLGCQPKISLQDGVSKTVEWYLANENKS